MGKLPSLPHTAGNGLSEVPTADLASALLCRGKYADVPYISESVYLQVDASL